MKHEEAVAEVKKRLEGRFWVRIGIEDEMIREAGKDPELARAMCERDGNAIQFIENPSEELIRIAIQNNPSTIQYVKQTPELCLLAVQKNGCALWFIKHPTNEVRAAAVKQNPIIYLSMRKTTPEIEEAAKCNWLYCYDECEAKRLYGNAKQVRKYMREALKAHKKLYRDTFLYMNPISTNDYMTQLLGWVVFTDFRITYVAYPETEPEDLTVEGRAKV